MTNRKRVTRVYAMLLAVAMILLGIVLILPFDSKASQVIIGIVFGVAASVPTSLLIAASSRQTQAYEEADSCLCTHMIVEEPIKTRDDIVIIDDRYDIPADLYLESINAINEKLASSDPDTRQLASKVYDAFISTVRPTAP